MPSAVVDLTLENNHLLNIIKAKFGLHNKSDAMNFIVQKYAKEEIEPELRPEYVAKLRRIMKQKGKVYPSLDAMIKEYGSDVSA